MECTCRPTAEYCTCGAAQQIAQMVVDAMDALDNSRRKTSK